METDNGIRGKNGVVLSLLDLGNNKLRIVMDDVSNKSGSSKEPWKHEVVVTWKDYDEKEITENSLSEEELAGLGAYVVARLAASKKHPYK